MKIFVLSSTQPIIAIYVYCIYIRNSEIVCLLFDLKMFIDQIKPVIAMIGLQQEPTNQPLPTIHTVTIKGKKFIRCLRKEGTRKREVIQLGINQT